MMKNTAELNILEQRLKSMISENKFLTDLLIQLHAIDPHAYLSAGVIRNWVWATLHGQVYCFERTEIDVIFHAQEEQHNTQSHKIRNALIQHYPHHIWDVTNQAWVHQWYRTEKGETILPLESIHQALSYWPETATAIALRLNENHQLDIIAPFGLYDLFELKLRWNDRLVSRGVFIKRIQSKQFLERWPNLVLID